jgi:hypothetical protein
LTIANVSFRSTADGSLGNASINYLRIVGNPFVTPDDNPGFCLPKFTIKIFNRPASIRIAICKSIREAIAFSFNSDSKMRIAIDPIVPKFTKTANRSNHPCEINFRQITS